MQNGLSPPVKSIADNSLPCLDLTMNFLVSQITSESPLKVTARMSLQVSPQQQQQQHLVKQTESELSTARTSCLNMLANAFGYIPLKYSTIRANPVLFRDNVSVSRKEFKRLESRWIACTPAFFQILYLFSYIQIHRSFIIIIFFSIACKIGHSIIYTFHRFGFFFLFAHKIDRVFLLISYAIGDGHVAMKEIKWHVCTVQHIYWCATILLSFFNQ